MSRHSIIFLLKEPVMSVNLANASFRFGITGPFWFHEDCTKGQWQQHPIVFNPKFSVGPDEEIVVIITPCVEQSGFTDLNKDPDLRNHNLSAMLDDNCFPVGVAANIRPDGFTLLARNSENVDFWSSFYWLAVIQKPDDIPGAPQRHVDVRFGPIQPPRIFYPSGKPGDKQSWDVNYGDENTFPTSIDNTPDDPLYKKPFVYVTASNWHIPPHPIIYLEVFEIGGEDPKIDVKRVGAYQNMSVVGKVASSLTPGFLLYGRNAERFFDLPGVCSFSYAAFTRTDNPSSFNVFVDSGNILGLNYEQAGKLGDKHPQFFDVVDKNTEVTFKKPFLTPPVVLITAFIPGQGFTLDETSSSPPSPVGIARFVTTHGFTLSSRNSSGCHSGLASMGWVALGCGQGCG